MLKRWIKKEPDPNKIKVAVLTNFASQNEYRRELKKYCNDDYTWGDLYLCSPQEKPDFYAVVNFTSESVEPSKTLLFQSEWDGFIERFAPKEWRQPHEKLLANFRIPYDHTLVGWGISLGPRKLLSSQPKKNKIISAVISNKNELDLQKKRLDFTLNFLTRLSCFEHFGQVHEGPGAMSEKVIPEKGFRGGYLKRKEEGLLSYRYTFASENSRTRNYITEKLMDAILCESLCFYDGCPNAEDFIDPKAFIRLNLDDPERSFEIVRSALESNEWQKRLEIIRREKKRILNHYHILARVEKFFKKI